MDYKKYFSSDIGFGAHRETAISLLSKTIDILNEFNIDHMLMAGTLLGYVRHNDFIPWDDDIDLLVDPIIFDKFDQIVNKYSNVFSFIKIRDVYIKIFFNDKVLATDYHGFDSMIVPKSKDAKYYWPFIDLFVYRDTSDQKNITFFKKEWDRSKFFPTQKISFLGMDTYIPNDPLYFLNLHYKPNCLEYYRSNHYIHKNEKYITDVVTLTKKQYDELCISDTKI